MKNFNFNPNVLTAGVALALGFGIASGVSASTTSGTPASPSGGVQISNTATASYSVDGVAQPVVSSNAVIVNISEVGSFTLYGTQGTSATDDKNENQAAVPGGTTTFTNKLTNTGNVVDTYTLNLTTNNDPTITTGNQDYIYTNPTTITYAIYNADGTVATTLASGQAQTGTVSGTNGTIKLLPGQYATLTYNVTSPTTVIGGQSGVGTLTATSSYISSNATAGAIATLVNENQAIVKLPVFAINKTAASTNINLNTASPTVDYTITVKNDGTATYAADAIGVLIQDKLPTGLTVSGGATGITVSSTDGTTTNGTAPTVTTSTIDGRQIIAINGVDLKVNETMTITFKAVIDPTKVDKAGVTNTAEVYDNYTNTPVTPGDTPTSDTKDSSGTSNPTDAKVPNDPTGTGTGGDSSTPITFTDRGLTLTGSTTAELPPTSSTGVTYTETVKNTGNTTESGLKFTITDVAGNNINVSNVVYTAPDGTKTTLTPDASGNYTIPSSLAAGATGTISYTVVTTGATIGSSETNTITLIPAAVTGTTTPTVPSVQNTTNINGMTLVKEQALDANCDKTPDTAFSTAQIDGAKPGQCIVYKITAKNTMTTKSLTNVVISDAASQWNTKATYVVGSIFDSANGTTVAPGTSAQSSTLTLAPGATGSLQFVIKLNNAN